MTRRMYDSTTAAHIPADAPMVAGYVDGRYRWSEADWARFPHAVKVRIACFAATNDGQVLDVELGCAAPIEAPGWAQRRRAAGVNVTVYANRSNLSAVRQAFQNARLQEPLYWLATLDGSTPWAPGIVAIQTTPAARSGGDYDLSDVADYWPGVDAGPPGVEDRMLSVVNWPGSNGNWVYDAYRLRRLWSQADELRIRKAFPDIKPTVSLDAQPTVGADLPAGTGTATGWDLAVTPRA